MKANQNLPNKQVTSNKMTSKPLPFSHRSRSKNTEIIQSIEAQISSHNLTQNLITVIVILNHPVEVVHQTQDH